MKKIAVTRGSTNVFADLGYANSEEMLANGVFQGSCRVNRFHYAAAETSNAGRSGFSMTAPTGSQFRVFPDHRSGRFAFAAS